MKKHIEIICQHARQAAPVVAKLSTETKNQVLGRLADLLISKKDRIKRENEKDLEAVRGKIGPALLDRLTLTDKRIEEMARGVREVQALPDPVGQVVKSWTRPNGLEISKVRIPLGVIGIIYESRPNVTIDAAALCLKSGNAVVLRGGSEAIHCNIFLGKLFRQAIKEFGLDPNSLQVIDTPDRKAMEIFVRQSRLVDIMIPRGGESLMKWMEEHSKVPVIKHDKGVCHVYVDEAADLKMAEEIAFNAKVQRPGVCNAMETLIVHQGIAWKFLPRMIERFQAAGVEVRGDPATRKIVPGVKRATERIGRRNIWILYSR
ncbi:MAG: glutamate-5-semialdehyde dehydrogenase [Deltaproteobacteria bacterium]|nr:glutamate-5-semialdehyde dehydrogenase [Deltaproteobacteria bacterium]